MGSGFVPTVLSDSLEVWLGLPAVGRARASNTTLDNVVFTQLENQTSAPTFRPEDVGCPIAIIGGGPVNPLMPAAWFVQGSMFVTTIASYVSPTEVTLASAPDTSIYNTGFVTVVLYQRVLFQLDKMTFNGSVAPGTRDTLDFIALAIDNPYIDRFQTIAFGQPVFFRSSDGAVGDIFGGFIDTCNTQNQPGYNGVYSWDCHCASWAALALRRAVPPALPQILDDDGDVVFSKIVLTYLNDEGVAVDATAAPNITVGCAIGARVNDLLDQCVSQITAATNEEWYWFADAWRTFILRPRSATPAPWSVSGGGNLLAGSQPIQLGNARTHDKLANFVYAVGTNVLVNALNATINGDGASRTFNLPQPIALVPVITLNGGPQTVGILGVESGKNWYWNQGSTTLTQDSSGTILTSSDALLVVYTSTQTAVAQWPVVDSLQTRSSNEATSGEFDWVIQITQPVTPQQLLAIAQGYAEQYGEPAQTLALSTLKPGLKAGQLQPISLPKINASGDYLIATVRMTTTSKVIQWDYTAQSGANVGTGVTGLVQFINRGQNTLALNQPAPVITAAPHKITIDHTKVAGSDKTDFIFCFTGTYDWLTGPPGGNVVNVDGKDIYFSTTQSQTGLLDFDLSAYDPTTGAIVAWVRIPTMSASTNTIIYIMYGDSSIAVSLANPHGVWSPHADVSGVPNANFHGVYHMSESTGPYADSSKYGNDSNASLGTGYPVPANGVFAAGKSQAFNGAQGFQVPQLFQGDGYDNFQGTMIAWMKSVATTGGNCDEMIDARTTTAFGHGFALGMSNDGTFPGGQGYGSVDLNFDGGEHLTKDTSILINDGTWHFVVATMSSTQCKIYVDGALGATDGTGQNWPMGNDPVLVGYDNGGTARAPYNGVLAEPRMCQAVLDADTILTWYRNQSSPSTFYAVSASASGGLQPQTTDVVVNPSGTVTHISGALTANLPVLGNGGGDVKAGVAGQLVPAGGTTGQVLAKTSGTDYATGWEDASGGRPTVHTEPLTDGNSNFIFAAGDCVVVIWVPN